MRTKPTNPARNQIPNSVNEESLIRAIENSGYPLQGIVATKLLKLDFHITEEWGFPDRESNHSRTLDLIAYAALAKMDGANVYPGLRLLIECKRSVHPYVFFHTLSHHDMSWFPRIAGLPHGGISLLTQVDGMQAVSRLLTGAESLGLAQLPFIVNGPEICAAFSRAEANGNKVVLSGADLFNKVVIPLAHASDHAMQTFGYAGGRGTAVVFPQLILCVAVLDAPMLLVESPEKWSDPILSPWVRVIRQEPTLDPYSERKVRHYGFDLVHIDFFANFVADYVLPFAKEFGSRAIRLGAGPMLNGGRVPDPDRYEWTQITELTERK